MTAFPITTRTPAQDLFSQGYRVQLTQDGNLLIITPEEKRYRVSANRTCTCPAGLNGRACKHGKSVRQLVLAQVEELWKEGAEWEIASVADDHNPKMRIESVRLIDAASALYAWVWETLR